MSRLLVCDQNGNEKKQPDFFQRSSTFPD
jgi:hypothetical protein